MTSSPVGLDCDAAVMDSVASGCEDSFGFTVLITPAVSPFESVTEVPFAGADELHAAAVRGSDKSSPVRAMLKA